MKQILEEPKANIHKNPKWNLTKHTKDTNYLWSFYVYITVWTIYYLCPYRWVTLNFRLLTVQIIRNAMYLYIFWIYKYILYSNHNYIGHFILLYSIIRSMSSHDHINFNSECSQNITFNRNVQIQNVLDTGQMDDWW